MSPLTVELKIHLMFTSIAAMTFIDLSREQTNSCAILISLPTLAEYKQRPAHICYLNAACIWL